MGTYLKEGNYFAFLLKITWKGYSSALAMPAPAHKSPPSHPGEVPSKKQFTSNAAKAEYPETGLSCPSSKEAGLGQVQVSGDNTGTLSDSPHWGFSQKDLSDAKLILRLLASPPFMSLPEHSCINLSSGCLSASYKLPPLGILGTSALP